MPHDGPRHSPETVAARPHDDQIGWRCMRGIKNPRSRARLSVFKENRRVVLSHLRSESIAAFLNAGFDELLIFDGLF